MTKFTKISATALFALFLLTGCDRGKADLEKVIAWDQANQSEIVLLQQNLQQAQNPEQAQLALNAFTNKINDTIKSLEALDIKDTQVVEFRTQAKEILTLSKDVIADSLKFAQNPNDAELAKKIEAQTQELITKNQALSDKQRELKAKFGIK